MKRYKLIKEYPGSPKLHSIIEECTSVPNQYVNNNSPKRECFNSVQNYPEFWEEIIEKDYEILSFICNRDLLNLKKGDIIKLTGGEYIGTSKDGTTIRSCKILKDENILKIYYWSIHSVKRLSDGEIFTIGDIIKHKKWNSIGTIKRFRELKDYILIDVDWNIKNNVGDDSEASLKNIEHYILKQPLFTTEDGVDIFKNDIYYSINNKWEIESFIAYVLINTKPVFSTKKAAEEYILINKPCLSLNDVYNTIPWLDNSRKSLKELVKSKLNL